MQVKASISLVIGDDPELVLTADEAREIYTALRSIFEPPKVNEEKNAAWRLEQQKAFINPGLRG